MPASPTPNFFSAARRVADWARLLVSSSNLLFMTCPLVVVLKCRRLAQMTTVKLGALDRRGTDKMRRPAVEDVCARHLPMRQITRALQVHRQACQAGDVKTELAG